MNLSLLRQRYHIQKHQAKKRGIRWRFTFQDWLQVWIDSGHLHERGRKKGQYVMARKGDVGIYSKNNVRIVTNTENAREYGTGQTFKEKHLPVFTFSGHKHTKVAIENSANKRRGQKRSEESKARMREGIRKRREAGLGWGTQLPHHNGGKRSYL